MSNATRAEIKRVIDPIHPDDDPLERSTSCGATDPIAAEIYLQHGQSLAKRMGVWFERIGGLFLRMLQMVAVPADCDIAVVRNHRTASQRRRRSHVSSNHSVLPVDEHAGDPHGSAGRQLIRPGLGNPGMASRQTSMVGETASLGEVLFNQLEAIIPSNPMAALTAPNFLSIIAFTITFGLFTVTVGGKTAERIKSRRSTPDFEVMMAMTTAIIRLAPIGVLFLIAYVTATQGADVFSGAHLVCARRGRRALDPCHHHAAADREVRCQAQSAGVRPRHVAGTA